MTAFTNDLENLIEFDFATSANANIGSATIRGAEMSWDFPLGRRGASFLQATYLDTEDDLGQPLLRRPEWSGSWTLHGAFSKHLNGDLTVVYVGSRDDVDPVTLRTGRRPTATRRPASPSPTACGTGWRSPAGCSTSRIPTTRRFSATPPRVASTSSASDSVSTPLRGGRAALTEIYGGNRLRL